jgi:hypothetical protein
VDEVRYGILPVAIREGIRSLEKLDRDVALHLAEAKAYKNGMVEPEYRVRTPRRVLERPLRTAGSGRSRPTESAECEIAVRRFIRNGEKEIPKEGMRLCGRASKRPDGNRPRRARPPLFAESMKSGGRSSPHSVYIVSSFEGTEQHLSAAR